MAETRNPEIQVKFDLFQYSLKIKSIFFPITLDNLAQIFKELNYTMRRELMQEIQGTSGIRIGTRLMAGGNIAQKVGTNQSFILEPDRGIISILGLDVKSVIEDFSRFEELVNRNLKIDLRNDAQFYEAIAHGSAETGSDPTIAISGLFSDSKTEEAFSKLLNVKTTNFGVRLVESNKYPTDPEWSEFTIEPFIPQSKISYQIIAVSRSADREKVINTASSLVETFKSLLSIIEQKN